MHVTQAGTKQARAAVGAVPVSAAPLPEAVVAPRKASAERLANVERLSRTPLTQVLATRHTRLMQYGTYQS